jgi:hypothetical protein
MMRARKVRFAMVAVAIVALSLVLLIAGCGSKSSNNAPTGPTALGSLAVASSSLSTMAPDAKLLVVQTAQAVTPTGTPVWAYLFGSPSSDKTYVVYTSGGQSMGAQEYGTAGLSADEWKNVPNNDSWKIDSDAAYTKAFAAGGGKGEPAAYMMGLLTYKSAEDTSTIKPFVWRVIFDPGTSGVTTGTVEVDANSGAASVVAE